MRYPIQVPPARAGLSPKLSINYSSSGGNGWLGVGWDLSMGFIQRRGPRKSVPKYNDTIDLFELNLGGASQELVPIGSGEYRLRIEGAYLKIKYYSSGNYWEVWDKSGTKMRFGYSFASRIGTIKEPDSSNNTYRWYLDRVEDAKTNYMEVLYFRDQDTNYTYQIYLNEIRYNGQLSSGLGHNHKIIFYREDLERADFIYNYRGGFKMLTRKRLFSIEIKTNDILVRKYQIQYPNPASQTRSTLSSITHYGKDGSSSLPPTNFHYQAHNPGFQTGVSWSYFGVSTPYWGGLYADHIQNIREPDTGTWSDVIDMNGDGLPDRVVASSNNNWTVYLNNVSGFNQQALNWSVPNGSGYIRYENEYGVPQGLIDMNDDGLPDRVVSALSPPYNNWTVYFNNGAGFNSGVNWPYPGGGLCYQRTENPSIYDYVCDSFIQHNRDYNYEIMECPASHGGIWADVIDMNGDGLPDRLVAYYNENNEVRWKVYLNNGSGFDQAMNWSVPNGHAYILYRYGGMMGCPGVNLDIYGVAERLMDMNGDGLPDRVVSS
jgi:hypothetical protein